MLILASNSPRRRRLLEMVGYKFSVKPSSTSEEIRTGEGPGNFVRRIAKEKALIVKEQAQEDSVILAADTVVFYAGKIFGKPSNENEAVEMLLKLCNNTHQVYTGLAVFKVKTGEYFDDICVTHVKMRDYSQSEIETYVASGDPMDKAGAYAVQHTGFHPVEQLKGCYTNIVGLPLCRTVKMLALQGEPFPENLAYPCLNSEQEACSFRSLQL